MAEARIRSGALSFWLVSFFPVTLRMAFSLCEYQYGRIVRDCQELVDLR